MTSPTISVCVPVFNGAAHIRECLDSIAAQTLADFEVLVIDDCSTDRTVELVQSYVRRDSRFRLLQNPTNLGMRGVPNCNRCFSEAAADWIKFVFQDDVIAPDCLRALAVARPSSPALVFSDRGFIFESGTAPELREWYERHSTALRIFHAQTSDIPAQRFAELALDHFGMNLVGEPTTVLLHRDLAERFGVFNPHITSVADGEYWTRIGTNIGAVRVDRELASFRVHSASTSARNLTRERKFRVRVLDPAVIRHEFAFHPAYEHLRELARLRNPRTDFEDAFWIAASEAHWWLRRIGRAADGELASEISSDWTEVTTAYPRFCQIPLRYRIEARIRGARSLVRRGRAGTREAGTD